MSDIRGAPLTSYEVWIGVSILLADTHLTGVHCAGMHLTGVHLTGVALREHAERCLSRQWDDGLTPSRGVRCQ